jgi:Tfp pilus assembly protein PilE
VELLVVISIIGILFYLSLPALKDFTKGDSVGAANRQLLDDVARARRLAINNHTTVYMLFMSTDIASFTAPNAYDMMQVTNLYHYQYSGYTFFSNRKAGDQPGEPVPHYFPGGWKMLPKNVFFATWKFAGGYGDVRPFDYVKVPFPTATNSLSTFTLPYIAFNYRGQLVNQAGDPMSDTNGFFYLPLARGALFYAEDGKGGYLNQKVIPQETPPDNSKNLYNFIEIDQFTGRARVKQPEIVR